MTNQLQTPPSLPAGLSDLLSGEDDPALWERVLQAVAIDASTLDSVEDGSPLYAEVGACSHWLRPHQTRWTAAGGFAYPVGYGDGSGFCAGLPRFDWSVILRLHSAACGWVYEEHAPAKGCHHIRVAIPSRTVRHRQAAVNTIWPAGTLEAREKRTVFYGFRRQGDVWEMKARKEYGKP